MARAQRAHKKDPRFAYTLAKGFQVLEAFAGRPPQLGNKELCAITGLSKSNVSRLTGTLCELGYLRLVPETGKFALALGVLSLGYPLLINLPIRKIARPLMEELAEAVRGVVNLGMRHKGDLVLVESCRRTESVATRPEIGARRSLARLPLGHVYLAGLPEDEREAALDELAASEGLDRQRLADAVRARVEELAKNRFGFAQSDYGTNTVAIPFVGSTTGERCIMHCVVEEALMPKKQMLAEVPGRLLRVIHTIQDMLGVDVGAARQAVADSKAYGGVHRKGATAGRRAARSH